MRRSITATRADSRYVGVHAPDGGEKHPGWYAPRTANPSAGEHQHHRCETRSRKKLRGRRARNSSTTPVRTAAGIIQGVRQHPLPAGYEQGKQHPMLTYIYEKLTQEYNTYTIPNATRYSNPSVYTNRGYAFFKPDIVYHVNDPGRSRRCGASCGRGGDRNRDDRSRARPDFRVTAGVGYQTARSSRQADEKIFKTAVAGAPLTDMVSMFGSIYSGTAAAPTLPAFIYRVRAASPADRTKCRKRTREIHRRTLAQKSLDSIHAAEQ